ncbi:conserved hypothetical protein [uncultured Eubacteriales bacterium]|uniref:Uncharacterized protein n=1 Tax=uncultured Eubacteriales bacterium TaxID=172733 RepID=A0A212JHW9_9FIRM|nr:conserved hypothetical protein [uncultured Eubacteriales bacterium]
MNFLLKSGTLYWTDGGPYGPALADIRNRLCGSEKQIIAGGEQFLSKIRMEVPPEELPPGSCPKQYLLKNSEGEVLLSGIPRYADGDDPSVVGWPIYRMPRVNSAELLFQGRSGLLQMINSQNYRLTAPSGKEMLTLLHRGIIGGWSLETAEEFSPELLCGIFIFCRYIEQENEFTTV